MSCKWSKQLIRECVLTRFGALGNFWLTLIWKAPSMKKVYLVNYAYLSRNWTNELRAKRTTPSWVHFNPFGSIWQLLADFVLKSAIYGKSLFCTLATHSWVRFNPFGSIWQFLADFVLKSAIYEKSLFSKLRVFVPKSNEWGASEASNSFVGSSLICS